MQLLSQAHLPKGTTGQAEGAPCRASELRGMVWLQSSDIRLEVAAVTNIHPDLSGLTQQKFVFHVHKVQYE